MPKPLIAQVLSEAGEGEAAATLAKLKKAEMISEAEAPLVGKRGLPALQRGEA